MLKHLQKLLLIAALCVPWVTQAQTPGDLITTFPYSCDFESQSVYGSWVMVNGTQENGWYIGTAVNATTGGSQSLYVSNNSGTSNAYSVDSAAASYSWAYQRFAFAANVYNISFSWKCQGEIDGDPYDYFRVFIVPDTVTLTAGVLPDPTYTWSNDFMSDVPTGWIGVNGTTTYFVGQTTFTTLNSEFAITNADNYKLVFIWLNDDNACNNPPASIDDILISVNTCPRPLSMTASGTETDATFNWVDNINGSWDLVYGPTGFNPDTATVNTVSDTFYSATNLAAGFYQAYVRANCGTSTSNWFGPVDFNVGIVIMNMAVTGSDTLRSCVATIYDDGGPNNPYSGNCQSTLVIYPSDDQHALQISGQSYTESTYDYLRIYEGLSTSSTPLFDDYGVSATQTFGPFITTDPVTVVFHSDGSVFYAGFEINVSCIPLPSCPRPASFVVDDITSSSVSFTWTDTENSNWVIVYGPAGFVIDDTSLQQTFTTTSGTISGLTPNTEYDFYLYGVCTDENSMPRLLSVRTACVPLTSEDLPYSYGFEGTTASSSGVIDACWYKGTNYSTAYPYPSSTAHSGNRSLYFYAYGSYYSYVVLPRYTDSVNTLLLTFWSRSSGSSYYGNLTAGVMTDPADISTFVPVKVCVPDGTNWTFSEVFLNSYHGEGEYIALLCDIYPGAYNYNYVYLDDITIQPLPTCSHVQNLTVEAATTGSAMITWDPSAVGEYNGVQFDYLEGEDTSWTSLTVTDTFYLMTDLTPGTSYSIRVAQLCDNDEISSFETASFNTMGLPCVEFDTSNLINVTIGSGTTTSTYIPSYSFYNYGYSQQIYTAHELGGAAQITKVTVYPSTVNQQRTYEIYMAHTPDSTLSAFLNPSDMTLVYNGGPIQMVANQPLEFELTTPFSYTGSGNLLVTFRDLTGSYVSGNAFYTTSAWSNSARYVYQDGSAYTPGSVTGGTALSVRNNMTFFGGTCTQLSSCAAPGVWVENLTADSVVIGIIPGASETAWDIYAQPFGGDMTYVASTDEMYYSLTGLNSATQYTVRVMAQCDDSLYSEVNFVTECGLIRSLPIVQTFENEPTGSSTTGSTFVRCWELLNNGTSYGGYPYVSSSSTYNHTENGTKGLYWYNATTTGTYGDYQIVVLPQLDTVALPISTTMLTFWAKSSSTSYDPTFYVGFLSDLDSVDNFVYYDTIHLGNSTTWQKISVMFDRYDRAANCSYIAIRANRESSYWYAYVDDIRLDSIPNCSPVEELTIKAGVTSAMVSWTTIGNSYNGAEVLYREAGASSWNNVQVNGVKYVALTGLTPDTSYEIRVSAMCDDGNSTAVISSFNTKSFPCSAFDSNNFINVTIGNETTTNCYLPTYSYYNYAYSQQIYTASEIGTSGEITKITVYPQSIGSQRTMEIYLAHTDQTTLTDFINPSDMTLVYNGGPVQMVADQPLEFVLTTPFSYNNSSNLLVTFRDMTGSYTSPYNYYYASSATSGAARYIYQDSGPYTPGSVSGGYSASVRSNITFFGGVCTNYSTCAAPIAIVTDVTTTTVELHWAPGSTETQWMVYYRLTGDDNWTFADTANVTNYTFTGLASGTPYEFRVENVCTDVYHSDVSAVTLCAEINSFPYTEDFNSWGSGSGTLPQCWYRTGSYSTYTYISTSANHSGTTGGSIYMYSSSTENYQCNLIMPAIDTNVVQANQLQVVFHTIFTSTSYAGPVVQVGVVTDPRDFNTFVPVDTVYHTDYVNEWEVFEVSLANYTGNGAHVAFRSVYPGAYTYFYLDDITLELIPTCQRPDNLQAGNMTASSVDLSWNERGTATQWQIEYGPVGFTPGTGTGTVVTVNTNPYTLTSLPASYQGEFYVKSICSSTESSEYSRIPGRISLQQIPATLPYDYDFESATEWANWQTVSNCYTNFYRGNAVAHSSVYSMYLSTDFGATYTPYVNNRVVNAAAYRDIDFGPIDSSYTMTFDARVGGTLSASYDGLMVFLVDTAGIPVSHSNNITSPWGNVNNLYRIATVRIDTTWQTYTCSFDTISGVHRVAFFWFNQNTAASYDALNEPAAIDNIHIDYSSCPRPVATQVVSVGSTTANLSWTGVSPASYEVIYRPYPNGTENSYAYSSTNSITLTGLEPVTQYAVWVRNLCSANDSSLTSDGITFRTSLCENSFVAQNFTANMSPTTCSYFPLGYATYNYSYVQYIFDSAYLAGMDGDITAFAFDPANTTSSDYYTHITMYMANVSESDVSSGFIHPDSTHQFVTVIDDRDLSFTETGYQIVGLDTAFTWDGHSNVLIAFNRQHGTWSSSTSFNGHTQPSGKFRYIYQDAAAYDPATVSGGYTTTAVGDIYLISCGLDICAEPTELSATDITYNSATLNWNGTAGNYELAYKASSDSQWPDSIAVGNATSYAVSNLAPATSYTFRVRAICDADNDDMSEWAYFTFTTDSLPCFAPSALQNTAVELTTATLDWTSNGEETAWRIYVWNTGTQPMTFDVTAHPATVTGLAQTTEYFATVVAVCGGGMLESETSDTISFTTATCQPVTNVAVSNIAQTAATVSWNGDAASYSIEYGLGDFEQGNGTTVDNITTTTYNITGLTPDRNYSVYVRANCDANNPSAWSQRVQFRTLEQQGIDDVNGVNVSIYPNPTSDNTTIALSGVTGEVTITIVDLSGRTVKSDSMSCDGDCVKTFVVSGLAEGAYFVRVSGEGVNMVKKLVVK